MKSGQERCVNYWSGHEKGHQFSRQQNSTLRQTPSLLVGAFHCDWDPEGLIQSLYAEIRQQEDREVETTFPDTAKRSGVRSVRCRFKGERPWHNRLKPATAGARILSLDG
ncbi:MAG: hypothetical protein LQ346_004407 [Caloplaca aetnensis]|nr:MAG: hypothetical protein LQ346_004407 [Caloplaca aetnensis]